MCSATSANVLTAHAPLQSLTELFQHCPDVVKMLEALVGALSTFNLLQEVARANKSKPFTSADRAEEIDLLCRFIGQADNFYRVLDIGPVNAFEEMMAASRQQSSRSAQTSSLADSSDLLPSVWVTPSIHVLLRAVVVCCECVACRLNMLLDVHYCDLLHTPSFDELPKYMLMPMFAFDVDSWSQTGIEHMMRHLRQLLQKAPCMLPATDEQTTAAGLAVAEQVRAHFAQFSAVHPAYINEWSLAQKGGAFGEVPVAATDLHCCAVHSIICRGARAAQVVAALSKSASTSGHALAWSFPRTTWRHCGLDVSTRSRAMTSRPTTRRFPSRPTRWTIRLLRARTPTGLTTTQTATSTARRMRRTERRSARRSEVSRQRTGHETSHATNLFTPN